MESTAKKYDSSHPLNVYKVHRILAHSYFVYFMLFLVGVFLDIVFPFKLLPGPYLKIFGFLSLFLATFLIFWAQHTSRNFKKDNLSKESFCHGPYCYTRSPTHWGLFLLILGFGIVADAVFIVLFTGIAFVITRLTFLDREEKVLAERYGSPYTEYKKSVRL